jgi:hypothetical protein
MFRVKRGREFVYNIFYIKTQLHNTPVWVANIIECARETQRYLTILSHHPTRVLYVLKFCYN